MEGNYGARAQRVDATEVDRFRPDAEAGLFVNLTNADNKETAAAVLHREYCSLTDQQREQTKRALVENRAFPVTTKYSFSELGNGNNDRVGWHISNAYGNLFIDTDCENK